MGFTYRDASQRCAFPEFGCVWALALAGERSGPVPRGGELLKALGRAFVDDGGIAAAPVAATGTYTGNI